MSAIQKYRRKQSLYLNVDRLVVWMHGEPCFVGAESGIFSRTPLHGGSLGVSSGVLSERTLRLVNADYSGHKSGQQVKEEEEYRVKGTYWVKFAKGILYLSDVYVLHANLLTVVCGGCPGEG